MVAVSLVISGLSASSSEHIHTTWRRGRVKRCTMGEEQRYDEKENELLMLRSQVIEDKIVSKSKE